MNVPDAAAGIWTRIDASCELRGLLEVALLCLQAAQPAPKPLYDPNGTDAIVLNEAEWAHGEGKDAKGRPVVAVVIDPYLGRRDVRLWNTSTRP